MAAKFAPTTFATKAEEKLAVVDAYDVSSAAPVTNILPDINDLLSVTGLSGLKGGNLGSALKYITGAGGKLAINPEALMKGVIAGNSGLASAMANLSPSMRQAILSGNGASNITATINGIKSQILKGDLRTLTSVGGLISGLAGSVLPISFTDNTGLSTLTANIVKQADELGITDSFKSISAGLQSNPSIMSAVTRQLGGSVVNRSSVNLLSNLSQSAFSGQLLSSRPTLISDFSKSYNAASGVNTSSLRTTLSSITASYASLDPRWKQTTALGGSLNLNRATAVSTDFDKLLKANANFASVKVATGNPTTINTSYGSGVAAVGADSDLAQLFALKSALPTSLLTTLSDPLACLRQDFELVIT